MWKSNVAGLRSCSSAFLQRGSGVRLGSRGFGRVGGLPYDLSRRFVHGLVKGEGAIEEDEFLEALQDVWPWKKFEPKSHKLGLAVSGGVDSMALATLYANSDAFRRKDLPEIHGFIIDHKARPESTEEAQWVANQLANLGCKATVIPLSWPEHLPIHSSRFESEARRLRYQALGIACRDNGISSLMVAHHADDQAETVMMRLLMGRLRSGLQGMKSVEWIPECFGIHGVYHSMSRPAWMSSVAGHTLQQDEDSLSSLVEHGGIQILRPLLGFEKKRLIATCEKHNTPWVEDQTNLDATLTTRNAVRYIFKNHQLPKALSKESLLALAQTTRSRIQKHQDEAEKIFNDCPIKLNIQTASLVVRLPSVAQLSGPSASNKLEARNTAYFLLQRISDLVSPKERPSPEVLANTVLHIWPELTDSTQSDGEMFAPPTPKSDFSSYGLWWRKNSECGDLDEWIISRQPPQLAENNATSITFPPAGGHLSEWHLYDGRFWVRVRNLNDRPVMLRMLTDEELTEVLTMKSKPPGRESWNAYLEDRRKSMRATLWAIQPHSLRRHIPGLFLAPTETHTSQLIALPTLESSDEVSPTGSLKCEWDVRYRKIDTGARHLSDIVVNPEVQAMKVKAQAELKQKLNRKHKHLRNTKKMNWDETPWKARTKSRAKGRSLAKEEESVERDSATVRKSYPLAEALGLEETQKKDNSTGQFGWEALRRRL